MTRNGKEHRDTREAPDEPQKSFADVTTWVSGRTTRLVIPHVRSTATGAAIMGLICDEALLSNVFKENNNDTKLVYILLPVAGYDMNALLHDTHFRESYTHVLCTRTGACAYGLLVFLPHECFITHDRYNIVIQ